MSIKSFAVPALSAALLLTACGTPQDEATPAANESTSGAAEVATPADGPTADVTDDSDASGEDAPAEDTAAEDTAAEETDDEASAAENPAPATVPELVNFTGTTVDGEPFAGVDLVGRPAVLWFWAPWCPTCRAQAPAVSALSAQYDGEVAVVGVGGLADADDIRGMAQDVTGPTHLLDEEGAVWRHFGVTAQSTYVVLDAQGAVVAEGYLDDAALAETVAGLVG